MIKRIFPVFLCLFFLCGCSQPLPKPSFDFIAEIKSEDFEGEIICRSEGAVEVKTVIPHELSGMTAIAGNSIVILEFAGMRKSSEDFPSVREFHCSRAALMLEALRQAELNMSAKEDNRVSFLADTKAGKLCLVTDLEGNILAVRHEESGYTLRLYHR